MNQNITDWSTHTFILPEKKIKDFQGVEVFTQTEAYRDLIIFITRLQDSVTSKAISSTPQNPKFAKFVAFIDSLKQLVDEVEPVQQNMRFGNRAFIDWHAKASEVRLTFYFQRGEAFFASLLSNLGEDRTGAILEVMVYFNDCFGSNVRIDYGTGHEMNFIILLLILEKLGFFTPADYESVVRNLFYEYNIKLTQVCLSDEESANALSTRTCRIQGRMGS